MFFHLDASTKTHRNVKLLSNHGNNVCFPEPEQSIVALPQLPPEPEPLHDWFQSQQVVDVFASFYAYLSDRWKPSDKK